MDDLSGVYVIFCGSISSQKHKFNILESNVRSTHVSNIYLASVNIHVRRNFSFNCLQALFHI